MDRLPTHSQLMLPLMGAIDELGGGARPADVVRHLADSMALSPEILAATVKSTHGTPESAFGKRVRWVRQDLLRKGFVSREKKRWWELTESGDNFLQNCRPGVIVTVFETELGTALWAEAEAASGIIADRTVQTILTSPPYPLIKAKKYGGRRGEEYLTWLLSLAKDWHRILADDGSLMLNLADVYLPGTPTLSLYQEKLLIALVEDLGFHLAQKIIWQNPCKMPSSAWVTVRRVRVNNSTESIFWLGKGANPKANNRRVLRPYAEGAKHIGRGDSGKKRPSGHGDWKGGFQTNHGGSIPPNLIVAANSTSNDAYCRGCREQGLPVHPARFPASIPEMLVNLTTDPGDLVYDPFGGSCMTAAACEKLGRRWVTNDKSLAYLRGGVLRFPGSELLLAAKHPSI